VNKIENEFMAWVKLKNKALIFIHNCCTGHPINTNYKKIGTIHETINNVNFHSLYELFVKSIASNGKNIVAKKKCFLIQFK
jgi:hypothetical protein